MSSTLDTTPQTPAWGVASNAEPLSLPPAYTTVGQALARASRPDYDTWLDHVRAAAGCAHPIRLTGNVDTVDAATGQRLGRLHTDQLPDAAIYKACGNRRRKVCPACSATYQADAYQIIRAFLVGGKGVPDTVTRHPAVFATFTAPSFGTVHTRVIHNHTCTSRRRCDCRADPCHARRSTDPSNAGLCPHGNPAVCWARHDPGDHLLGQPLCPDCYHYDQQVVWNLFAGELWRRTKQAAERHLAQLARCRGILTVPVVSPSGKVRRVPPVRLAHGKAAEFQTRAAVHFHALLRLDGVNPADPDAVVPPPAGFSSSDLEDALRHACAHVGFHTPHHPDQPGGWPITWGEQLDIRHITLTGAGEVTDGMVAGYLAKYVTKDTEVTGHTSARLHADTIDQHADPDGAHTARLIDTCWRLGRPTHTPTPLRNRPRPGDGGSANRGSRSMWSGLRRWAHRFGFGGHPLTKTRRHVVTFRLLRDQRITYRRHQEHDQDQGVIHTADHTSEETTLTIGVLTYAGSGWHTTGDALLANTAAAHARERQRAGREELAHELGTTITGTLPAVA
jgi:replication initiator protein RepSA